MDATSTVAGSGQVVLYRCRVPSDWLCPCGTVARSLRKRGIPFQTRRVAWSKRDRPEVVALSGQSRVPVVVVDSEAISDSKRIIEHLEWRFSEPDRAGG